MHKMKKNILILLPVLFVYLFIYGCSGPDDVISPTHYTRVPKADNLSAAVDTTDSGNHRVTLNWSVNSTTNLRDFEVNRSYEKRDESFVGLSPKTTTTTYVDTTFRAFDDTLKVYYRIVASGFDRFVGEPTDILEVIIIKPSTTN